jgi:hypothetical protein
MNGMMTKKRKTMWPSLNSPNITVIRRAAVRLPIRKRQLVLRWLRNLPVPLAKPKRLNQKVKRLVPFLTNIKIITIHLKKYGIDI